MKAVVSGAIFFIVAVILGLIFLVAVFGFGGTAQGLQKPVLGFFELADKLLDFFGQKVFLASQESKDFFCGKQADEIKEMCKISETQLKDYCNSNSDERAETCQSPPEGMEGFCKLGADVRDKKCEDKRSFLNSCDQFISAIGAAETAKEVGGLIGPGVIIKVTELALCK